MSRRPIHGDERHRRRRPRVSEDPGRVDSCFRGKDVTFERASLKLLKFGDKIEQDARNRT